MKKEDIKNSPKLFCESVSLAFTPEYFIMGVTSGNKGTLYTMTPQHTKRLQQYLTHQLEEFEKNHGEIEAKWDPNVVSPVQRANPPTKLS